MGLFDDIFYGLSNIKDGLDDLADNVRYGLSDLKDTVELSIEEKLDDVKDNIENIYMAASSSSGFSSRHLYSDDDYDEDEDDSSEYYDSDDYSEYSGGNTMGQDKNVYEFMAKQINDSDISEEEKAKLTKALLDSKNTKVNLMITGCTGCGKSSTINALFNVDKDPSFAKNEYAKVGVSADPETMEITRYELGNLILWDTPGLGDGKNADERHKSNILNKLHEKDDNGDLLIDLVLVIVDGSNRDMGTSYKLINEILIPELGNEAGKRMLVAINKADVAMNNNSRHFNYETHQPDDKLKEFLKEKEESVRRRIRESTGIDVETICYSAGFKEEGESQESGYNLGKLFTHIVEHTPEEKRIHCVENINTNEDNFKSNDDSFTNRMKKLTPSVLGVSAGLLSVVSPLVGLPLMAVAIAKSAKNISDIKQSDYGLFDNPLLKSPKELIDRFFS